MHDANAEQHGEPAARQISRRTVGVAVAAVVASSVLGYRDARPPAAAAGAAGEHAHAELTAVLAADTAADTAPPGTFTHEDSGYSSSASGTSLAVRLPGAVSAGDLLVLWVQSAGAGPGTSVSDDAGNAWANAYNGQLWYCTSARAAPSGVTITATVPRNAVYQLIADRFTPSGPAVFGGFATSGSAGTLGLNYNAAGCGDLGAVPAQALAWGAFSTNSGSGGQSYTPGFQAGTAAPADVIGSQFTGPDGTGLSVFVTDCAASDAALTWYGTGAGAIGSSGSMYFTTTAPPPASLFTHQDSVIAQATGNVTVLTATLSEPVNAGDLLVCAVKSPDGAMTSANLSDTAGNTWAIAGGGNYLYLSYVLAANAAPDGLTVTVTTEHVSHHAIVIDRFTPAAGYAAAFAAFSDNLALSSFSTGLNYEYGNLPPGTIAGAAAGSLAYAGFFTLAGDPSCVYSGGYQDGSGGTPAVIGSQVTEANGDGGFSEYVLSTGAQAAVAMQWYGTGTSFGGWAVQATFTAGPPADGKTADGKAAQGKAAQGKAADGKAARRTQRGRRDVRDARPGTSFT